MTTVKKIKYQSKYAFVNVHKMAVLAIIERYKKNSSVLQTAMRTIKEEEKKIKKALEEAKKVLRTSIKNK